MQANEPAHNYFLLSCALKKPNNESSIVRFQPPQMIKKTRDIDFHNLKNLFLNPFVHENA